MDATRLYPLTENFPKPLLKVGEKGILDWLVDDIDPLIDEFIVVSNHKFEERFQGWADNKPQKITVIDDGTESNETRLVTVKDIQLAAQGITEDCVVMAGYNDLDFSLQHFVRFAQEKGTSCVMYHEENRLEALQKTAVIMKDENNLIISCEEKPKEPRAIMMLRHSISTASPISKEFRKL